MKQLTPLLFTKSKDICFCETLKLRRFEYIKHSFKMGEKMNTFLIYSLSKETGTRFISYLFMINLTPFLIPCPAAIVQPQKVP